jgi:hypothetical protein
MKKLTFAVALLTLVNIGTGLQAKTIDIQVSQIAVITPPQDNEDTGLGPRLCLRFDLPEAVRGIEIGFAEVALNWNPPALTEDSLVIFEAFALITDWNEGARWSDFPVPGGDADSSLYATITTWCGRDTALSLDVTEMARKWNVHREANFGLILIPRNTDWRANSDIRFVPEHLRSRVILKVLGPGRAEQ